MEPEQADASSVFMCKICNLFSPNKSLLLSHVLETHTSEDGNAEDIIIPLKPLLSPQEQSTERVVKRKRGRPKGSTKKPQADELRSNKVSGQPKNETSDVQSESTAESQTEDANDLECKKCQRKFSNKRQSSKHICFAELKVVPDEDELHDPDPDDNNPVPEDDVECSPKKARTSKTDKVPIVNYSEPSSCTKNPIINVVLAAHKAIPGATKIVPIEASPAEAATAAGGSTDPQEPALKKGYQEYVIHQAAYEAPLTSNRLGQTQLKIFTCEYCNKVFKFKHSLQSHLRIHTKEKPFKCTQCDYASAIKANLSVHMRKHTGEKFSCEHCSFQCLSKGHLKVHVERVHQKIKQHCRFCKKKYSDIKSLLKHIRESHDMQDEKVKDCYDEYKLQTREGKRQLLYECNVCDRKFKYELERDRHLMVHGSNRPYSCELCDHGATKFQALLAHVRKHPFVYMCAICLRKFVSTVRLKSHFQESHPEVDESTVFAESMKHSFCVLKPGDGVQRDMLSHEDVEITKELSLLNTQDVLVAEMDEQEVQTQDAGNLAVETLGRSNHEDLPSTTNNTCPIVETGATVENVPNKEQLQDKLLNVDCTENPGDLPSHCPTSEISYLSANHQILPEVSNCTPVAHSQTESSVTQSASAPSGTEDSNTTQYKQKSAFEQILDQIQKKQLSMELFERIRKVHGDLECEYCGKFFWYRVHYNMHVRTHTREHQYYCSQCSYSSITKNCLKRHVIQRHSNVFLKCPSEGCEYSTPDKYKLQAHLKTHSEIVKKIFVCPACKKPFPEDKLRHHITTSHPDASLSTVLEALGIRAHVKGVIGKRGTKCPYCEFYCTRNGSDMQQHIWAHEGVKPFKCLQCDYASRSRSNLKAHMNRHNTEKTHLCDLCGKKFKSKCTLKSHKLMHSADGKQFKCSECDFTAAKKPYLLRHMEQHASFKPFRCAHCHYSCNISGSLKRHYNKKHPEEQYSNAGPGTAATEAVEEQGGVKCPVCNYVYGTKWEMNRHLKCKHRLKVLENQYEVVESAEEPTTQYLQIAETQETQGTEAAVSVLQNLRFNTQNGVVSATATDRLDPESVNILQQIIELGTENPDATVASVVAMAPGTVTVVEQVTEEEQQTEHAMMIHDALQQATVGLGEEHHLVVSSDDMEGIKTVTVYTQGEDTSQFIVYVQEAVQTEESTTEVA
ncbi:zinc finger protein ZFAT-like [Trichomycterus rosablanca]|uniref:zinc finger protein ZFAT-like n=1 Tax=Trichomycterus rosablanca TaxID=2290929 RepID=UPI002F34F59E